MNNAEKEVSKIINWIRENVNSAKASGVVLGLSGGIDSAVVAALCKIAFPDNTLCLIMPCYSNDNDEKDAKIIAKKLDLETKKIELNTIYDAFRQQVDSDDNDVMQILGNVKSRLRMITLYYYAAKFNYLVVGPTNKSEFVIGYFTKHGDSGVDLMPIASYVKEEIYAFAKYLDIPGDIINKIPSAGLWDGQTDEKEMEMTYKELDYYITNRLYENGFKNRIEAMIKKSEHKRNYPKVYNRF